MKRQAGFTLLEVLVATTIMAIAITALLSNLSTSMRTAGRLTQHDRAAMLARAKMDELMLDPRLPHSVVLEGAFDAAQTGWQQSGWRAAVRPFEMPPSAGPGTPDLERVHLEIWWTQSDNTRRTFTMEGFRRGTALPEDLGAIR